MTTPADLVRQDMPNDDALSASATRRIYHLFTRRRGGSLASGIAMTSPLFSPFRIGKLDLENRLVCLPLYLAYPDTDHQVNDLVLDYYAEMAASVWAWWCGKCHVEPVVSAIRARC